MSRESDERRTPSKLVKIAGRAGWAVGDQALSSLINFAIGVGVARTVDPDGFGAFTLAFSTYLIVLNVVRAYTTQPLLIRYSDTTLERWRGAAASATGALIAGGAIAGFAIAVTGAFVSPPLGPALLALAVALVPLLVQDGWRSTLFAAGRGRQAFLVDFVNAIVLVPAIVAASMTTLPQPSTAIIAWGLATIPASALAIHFIGVMPAPRQAVAWVSEHRDIAPRYAVETAIGLVAGQGAIYVVGAVSGLSAAGSIRAALLLLGPLFVLIQAAFLFALPEVVRSRGAHPRLFVPSLVAVSGVLTVGSLTWLGFVLLLPAELGREILGASWSSAQSVVLPAGLWVAGQCLAAGPIVGLRALADAATSLRVRLLDAPIGFALASTGALVAGAQGAAWGFATSGVIGAALFTIGFVRSPARIGRAAGAAAGIPDHRTPVRAED